LRTELRAIGRAVLVMVVVVAGACSFKDKGINTVVVDDDAGVGGTVGGGTGGGAAGTGGLPGLGGTGGSRLDGSTAVDGPPPVPGDAATPADLTSDTPAGTLGAACTADGACASGFCADGVCCNQRCGDPCFSCNGMTNGAAPGTCKADVANTVCGNSVCMGSTFTPVPRCDGNGACVPRPAMACANNFSCANNTGCNTKCASNGDCAGGMVCEVSVGTCRPPGKLNGQACAAGTECSSGNCADKVCCDLACTGTCRACVMAQTGKPDGTCANVSAGVKDARCVVEAVSTCGRDGTCDGAGHCRNYVNGTRCGTGCCGGNSGPGGGEPRTCAFECNNGTCDHNRTTILDRCGGIQCCCPGAVGGAACTGPLACPGGCAQ
jgi:hypothetical protein